MRALTLFRAMAWFGVVIVFWSLNVHWGVDTSAGNGPPAPWHRAVVGSGLLAFIAAFVLSISGRKDTAPAWWARGVAGACALGMLLIAWNLYGRAIGPQISSLQGTGYPWLLAGSGMMTGAVIGTLGLKSTDESANKKNKGKRRKRR